VEGHVVERDEGEENAAVALELSVHNSIAIILEFSRKEGPTDQVGNEQENVLLLVFVCGAHRRAIAVDGLL
jgi:hypothetical protein